LLLRIGCIKGNGLDSLTSWSEKSVLTELELGNCLFYMVHAPTLQPYVETNVWTNDTKAIVAPVPNLLLLQCRARLSGGLTTVLAAAATSVLQWSCWRLHTCSPCHVLVEVVQLTLEIHPGRLHRSQPCELLKQCLFNKASFFRYADHTT